MIVQSLFACPLRECQGAKAPYSVRATKWFVPTAEHRHSRGHHWGRSDDSFLSLKRKCPPEQKYFSFFLFLPLLLTFLSAAFVCLVQALAWITTMTACSTPTDTVFKRPLSHTLSSWEEKTTIRSYCIARGLALNLQETILLWESLLDFWYRF